MARGSEWLRGSLWLLAATRHLHLGFLQHDCRAGMAELELQCPSHMPRAGPLRQLRILQMWGKGYQNFLFLFLRSGHLMGNGIFSAL